MQALVFVFPVLIVYFAETPAHFIFQRISSFVMGHLNLETEEEIPRISHLFAKILPNNLKN